MLRVFERIGSPGAAAPNDRPAVKRRRRCLAIGLLLLVAAMPSTAMAHDDTGLTDGFVAELTHPLSGFDHLLAMGSSLFSKLPPISPVRWACRCAAAANR